MVVAHLEWTPGGGLQQVVKYKKEGDSSFTDYETVSGSTGEINILGLDPNTVYEFLIVNQCVFDLESSSDLVQSVLIECPLLSVEQAALSLTVSFTHLGGDIDQYLVQIYEMPAESFVDEELVDSPSGSIEVTFSDLSSDTDYKIKVIPQISELLDSDSDSGADDGENTDCTITERTLGCAEDYTLAPDGSYCYLIEETAPDPPTGGTPENTVAAPNGVYSSVGSYIYDFGFNSNGTGTSTQISLGNSFWVNGPGDGDSHSTVDGPMNRCALWSTSELDGQDVGFSVCLDLPDTNVYYIGVGGDNRCRIVIDGVVVVDQDLIALDSQYHWGDSTAFKFWHIYPVTLASGPHIIELIGHNDNGPAGMGAEIYHNTSAEIAAATSYDDLDLIFSTKDYIGQPVQLGSDDVGYTCPSGYSLAACEDPFVCRRILTALPS
jgi:hypothetical protein